MSPRERAVRSKLAQIVSGQALVRGTLLERTRACGNPRCRCARGPKHPALYLVLSQKGKLRQLYVPKDFEQRVRRWVANHHATRDLLKELSEVYWQKVQRRQG
jgi:hypothetical protein